MGTRRHTDAYKVQLYYNLCAHFRRNRVRKIQLLSLSDPVMVALWCYEPFEMNSPDIIALRLYEIQTVLDACMMSQSMHFRHLLEKLDGSLIDCIWSPLGHLPHNSHIFWVDPLKIVHTLCLEFHYDLCLVLPGDTCVSYGRLCFIRGFAMLFPKNYFMAPRTYSYLHSVFWLSHTLAHPFPIHT